MLDPLNVSYIYFKKPSVVLIPCENLVIYCKYIVLLLNLLVSTMWHLIVVCCGSTVITMRQSHLASKVILGTIQLVFTSTCVSIAHSNKAKLHVCKFFSINCCKITFSSNKNSWT